MGNVPDGFVQSEHISPISFLESLDICLKSMFSHQQVKVTQSDFELQRMQFQEASLDAAKVV